MGTAASTSMEVAAASTSEGHPGQLSPSTMAQLSPSESAALADRLLPQSPILSSSDGYKWRKYGQKNVKGSEYPRNYYKCTFPGCGVKKYVEKIEEDGKQIDKVYYKGGEHTHDPSRITRLNAPDQITFKKSQAELIVKTEARQDGSQTDELHSQETETTSSQTVFPASPRLVVETTADVDSLDDGYNWRKYGQKKMKDNPVVQRCYYKCTEENCPVKKQVEQRGNSIINIYEGTHNHPAPGNEELAKKRRKLMSENTTLLGLSEAAKGEVQEDESQHTNAEEALAHIPLQELQSEHTVEGNGTGAPV